MPSLRHLAVHYYSQVIDRVNTIKDDTTQHVRKFNRMTQSWERDRTTRTTQPVYSNRPESSSNPANHAPKGTVSCHVVSIKKYPYVPKNPRDLIHKPINETEWPQKADLRDAWSDQNFSRNTVTHPYAQDPTRKVRTQPLTAGWLNISRHFIQEQTMTHLSKGLRKVRVDWIHLNYDFKTKEEYSSRFETVDLPLTKPYWQSASWPYRSTYMCL
jgi:hypothetical protein